MMKPRTPAAPSDFAIRDVVYAEHYGRRIATAVNQQILHFSQEMTLAMLRAYPEGSAEYFVVVEAIRRAGADLFHPSEDALSSKDRLPAPQKHDHSMEQADRPRSAPSHEMGSACAPSKPARTDLRAVAGLPPRDPAGVLAGPWSRG